MRFLVSIIFCAGLVVDLVAQNVSFTASTNAAQVAAQSVFQVTFTLQNATGKDFRPPDFKGFDYVAGPSQSRSTSILNGVMTQSLSYTYSLMRIRPGIYMIGSATINADGKTLTTSPVRIQVVKGAPQTAGTNPGGSQNVFLRAVISSTKAYPGQQIRLDYKVYTTVNVRNYNTLREDDYAEFYYRYVQNFNNRASIEVIDGVQYTVQTIKSLALFPQQTGVFSIAPMVVSLGVAVKEERPSLIFGNQTTPVNVASDSIRLTVLPLPDGAPPQFSGAVGKYQMTAQINKQNLTTDDALVLTLDITGDGDPKRWSSPDLSSFQSDYELYEPKILIDESKDENGAIRHRRMVEYLLMPRRPGDRILDVGFVYFDPEREAYQTVTSPHFNLGVGQGTKRALGEQIFSDNAASRTMRALKPMRAGSNAVFLFSPVYFVLLVLPLLGLGGIYWMRRKQDLFDALDPVEKKKRKARILAEKYLQDAKQNIDGTERSFFDSISRAIFSYLGAKLNIPASELSKANIAMHLDRLHLDTDLRNEVVNILRTSEEVLYAGGSTTTDRTSILSRTMVLIEKVEEKS